MQTCPAVGPKLCFYFRKEAPMKSLLRIIRRYVFAAFFLIILILFLDIAAYLAMFFGLGGNSYGNRGNLVTVA